MVVNHYAGEGCHIIFIQLNTIADIIRIDLCNIERNTHIFGSCSDHIHRSKFSVLFLIIVTNGYGISFSSRQLIKGYFLIIRANSLNNLFSRTAAWLYADFDLTVIAECIVDAEVYNQLVGTFIDALDIHAHSSGDVLTLIASVDGTAVSSGSACSTGSAVSAASAVSAVSTASAASAASACASVSADTTLAAGSADTTGTATATDSSGSAFTTCTAVSSTDGVSILLASQIKGILHYVQC